MFQEEDHDEIRGPKSRRKSGKEEKGEGGAEVVVVAVVV